MRSPEANLCCYSEPHSSCGHTCHATCLGSVRLYMHQPHAMSCCVVNTACCPHPTPRALPHHTHIQQPALQPHCQAISLAREKHAGTATLVNRYMAPLRPQKNAFAASTYAGVTHSGSCPYIIRRQLPWQTWHHYRYPAKICGATSLLAVDAAPPLPGAQPQGSARSTAHSNRHRRATSSHQPSARQAGFHSPHRHARLAWASRQHHAVATSRHNPQQLLHTE
jgi:hypothetical protein